MPSAVLSAVARAAQGGVLVKGGAALEAAVGVVLSATAGFPHVFNLGHGITPEAPVEHVEALMRLVRKGHR